MKKIRYIIIILVIGLIGYITYKNLKLNNNNPDENTNEIILENNQIISNINENTFISDNDQEIVFTEGKIIASNGFEFDEQDLKEKIGMYLIYENFMQDYFIPEQELENANIVDYANEAKVFIGIYLASKIYDNPTEEQVRKAVEEFCGEHYEDYIDTAEYWAAFDGNDAYEFVGIGDYNPAGYCNKIESITEQDGKYTVIFIYSRPSEGDYDNQTTLDSLPKFRKQFTFVYHGEAQYTKYQLMELSFLRGEELLIN